MKEPIILDAHEDIALNALYATAKDLGKEYGLHEGHSPVGFAVNNNVDIPRLRKGNVGGVFATIFSLDERSVRELQEHPPAGYNVAKLSRLRTGLAGAREQWEYYERSFARFPDDILHVRSLAEYRRAREEGKVAVVLHSEGVDYFMNVADLEVWYERGLRSLALTWRNRNAFGGGTHVTGGLTADGRALLALAQERGVIIDLAHANTETFFGALEVIDRPCLVSHTNCARVHPHVRNVTDEQIREVAARGGVIGIAAIPEHIGGHTIAAYLRHIEHVCTLVGPDHACFGTDFDGMVDPEDTFIEGFEDVSKFGNVVTALHARGFTESDISKICAGNLERILRATFRD